MLWKCYCNNKYVQNHVIKTQLKLMSFYEVSDVPNGFSSRNAISLLVMIFTTSIRIERHIAILSSKKYMISTLRHCYITGTTLIFNFRVFHQLHGSKKGGFVSSFKEFTSSTSNSFSFFLIQYVEQFSRFWNPVLRLSNSLHTASR